MNFENKYEVATDNFDEIQEMNLQNQRKASIHNFDHFLNDNEVFLKKFELEKKKRKNMGKKEMLKINKNQFIVLKKAIDVRSLLLFHDNGYLRELAKNTLASEMNVKIIHFLIFLAMVNVTLKSYDFETENNIKLKSVVEVFDYLAYTFFIFEVNLKIIANGFIFGEKAFLKDFYNLINLLGVFGFLIIKSGCFDDNSSIIYHFAYFFKTLLPLRIFEHYHKLEVLALSLKQSLDQILNVAQALLIVWFFYMNSFFVFGKIFQKIKNLIYFNFFCYPPELRIMFFFQRSIFAIWGMILFRERFGYCQASTNYSVGIDNCPNGQWQNYRYNFNNFPNACLCLLSISSFDNWSTMLKVAANSDLSTKVLGISFFS